MFETQKLNPTLVNDWVHVTITNSSVHSNVCRVSIDQRSSLVSLSFYRNDCGAMAEDFDGFKVFFEKDCTPKDQKFFRFKYPNVDNVANERVHCTSCDCHIGTAPSAAKRFRTHPVLGVTQCNDCFNTKYVRMHHTTCRTRFATNLEFFYSFFVAERSTLMCTSTGWDGTGRFWIFL